MNPPERKPPDPKWEHYSLWVGVQEALRALRNTLPVIVVPMVSPSVPRDLLGHDKGLENRGQTE